MRKPRVESPASSGFTLIEVLVALAIAALGLALLTAATGTGLENAAAADAYIQAVGRAQTRMAQVGVTMPLKRGDYAGDDGGGFRWRIHIGPPITHGVPGGQVLGLYPVRTMISWRGGFLERSVALNSERMGPP